MSLVPSLLQAIIRVDGEALVMHVGEKPYVVSPTGQVDLATRGLTFDAVNGIVAQLLPAAALKVLEDVGATQFELPILDEFPGEHFTVTAARGGDDVWAEIRRRQVPDDDIVPADIFTGLPPAASSGPRPEGPGDPGGPGSPDGPEGSEGDDLTLPKEDQLWPRRPAPLAAVPVRESDDLSLSIDPPPVPGTETTAEVVPIDVVTCDAAPLERPDRESAADTATVATVIPLVESPVGELPAVEVLMESPVESPVADLPLNIEASPRLLADAAWSGEAVAEEVQPSEPQVPTLVAAEVGAVESSQPATEAPDAKTDSSTLEAPSAVRSWLETLSPADVWSRPELWTSRLSTRGTGSAAGRAEEPLLGTPVPSISSVPSSALEPEPSPQPAFVETAATASEAPVMVVARSIESAEEPVAVSEAWPAEEPGTAAETAVSMFPSPQIVTEDAHSLAEPEVSAVPASENAVVAGACEPPTIGGAAPDSSPTTTAAASEAGVAEPMSEPVMSTLPPNVPAHVPYPAPVPVPPVPSSTAAAPSADESPIATSGPELPAGGTFAPFPSLSTPSQPAVVLPIGRGGREMSTSHAEQGHAALERLLRLAASRGASSLYLSSNARPSARLDGDIQTLDGTSVLSPEDVESMVLGALPERRGDARHGDAGSEWVWDLAEVGRVRCTIFRDHRGPGAVFRLVAVRPQSASQLGLSREIQGLAAEPDGLVLVSGPRANGKSTLLSSFVDLINRTRRDYVITVETEINVVHERQGAFISQREVRGGTDEMLLAARAALREDPDVLVLDDLRSSALMTVALDAAAAGQLVIAGVPAHHATGAIERLIDLYQPEHRRQVQLLLAQNLRGVVNQVLLRKTGGGRIAAREVLLNTALVESLLAEGRTEQLPLAIEAGRKHGMVPLNDALVGFVQGGAVEVREAYRRATDRAGLLDLLKRQGIDTSFVERLA